MHVFYYDDDGNYTYEEYVNSDVLPPNSTNIKWDPSIISPRFDKKKNTWVESATEEYKESIKPIEPEPSEFELLQKQFADLFYVVAIGGE
ncbi:hypothetical protein MOF25_03480 [Bacillus atrophaeus]|uniref:hypothetical protein n=1 Tax=Bacillus atrophaeus TaxID=1452 RepID=UPI0022816DF2|nr:hypothetical protein [Bacillus atrophaeus]MCY8934971.1 hypothetical protein [Bacillus atrophaeus]MCY9159399.1 hypothetical protein [Bacillus atrophaeus]